MSKKNINESNLTLEDFKVGDRIIYTWKGNLGDENLEKGLKNALHGLTGTVIKNYYNNRYLGIQFDKKLHFLHDCHGLGEKLKCYYVIPSAVEHLDPAKEEERRRKKEELRLKMMDVDPYGEEDWADDMYESKSMITKFKIFENIDDENSEEYKFKIGDICLWKYNVYDVPYQYSNQKCEIIDLPTGDGDDYYQVRFDDNSTWFCCEKDLRLMSKEDFERYEDNLSKIGKEYYWIGDPEKNDMPYELKYKKCELVDIDEDGYVIRFKHSPEIDWYCNWEDLKTEYEMKPYFKRQEEIRLKMMDIDPYGEEDWEDVDESKINIILENRSEKLYVEVHSKEEDIILREYLEKLGFRWNSGNLPTNLTYYSNRNYVYVIELNRKRIGVGTQYHKMTKLKDFILKYNDLKRNKEELRLKMMDIDPYGEEDWENESIDHSDIDPYGEEDWNEEKDEYYIIETQDRFFLSKKTTHLIMNRYRNYIYNIAWLDPRNDVHFDRGYGSSDPYPVSDKEKDKILNGKINVCYIKNFGNIYSSTLQELCDMTGIDIRNIKFHKW